MRLTQFTGSIQYTVGLSKLMISTVLQMATNVNSVCTTTGLSEYAYVDRIQKRHHVVLTADSFIL